jgi:GTP-binding protein HflX
MRVVLVGAGEARHLAELGRLAGTLGLEVVRILEQGRRDGTGYLGRGKREELGGLVEEVGAAMVVADDELTASQARVLERAAGVAVVDRTELIIRIFESHARDAASRLQVELAELEYRLPRVKGRNPELSRLGGGGAITRGPGEQQLEYDRRAIRRRMETISLRLQEEEAARSVRGARMKKGGPPTVALVGYTNAGKTTILNALSGASRSTKDRLFETLETTTRLVEGGGTTNGHNGARPDFVVTDTVGFIRKLPTQLVHSFASTLEAAKDADVRVLCADASSEELEEEIQTVRRTLSEVVVGAKGGGPGGDPQEGQGVEEGVPGCRADKRARGLRSAPGGGVPRHRLRKGEDGDFDPSRRVRGGQPPLRHGGDPRPGEHDLGPLDGCEPATLGLGEIRPL